MRSCMPLYLSRCSDRTLRLLQLLLLAAAGHAEIPEMSNACKLKTGLTPNNGSMEHSAGFEEKIISSWGVLVAGPPAPLDMLVPPGNGAGEYFQCVSNPGYDFWSVAVSSGRHYIGSVDAAAPHGSGGAQPVYRSAHQRDIQAWRPQPEKQHGHGRRRLFGGSSGPPSIGICLPEVCKPLARLSFC